MRLFLPLFAVAAVACSTYAPADDGGEDAPDAGFDLTGDFDGGTFSLTWVAPGSLEPGAPPELGEVLYSAPAAERIDLDLPPPPEADMREVDAETGARGALYVPAVHVDTDGDGHASKEETLLGVGLTWLVYVDGEVTDGDLAGVTRGWNAVTLPFGVDETPTVTEADAIELESILRPRSTLTFGGAWTGTAPVNARLAVVSTIFIQGGAAATPVVWDGGSDDPWSITLDTPPHATHFRMMDEVGVPAALESPVAYRDQDGSSSFSQGDTPLHAVCSGSEAVGLIYFAAVKDFASGLRLSALGITPGWALVPLSDPSGAAISGSDLNDLDVTECGG